jgi:N-acylglucosamine-6-phosphate 2-epimerase
VSEALERMRRGLVVSVQAPPGSPLAAPVHMAALARAAEAGGALGIRADGPGDVAAIKEAVSLPVIGLRKRGVAASDVYITPTLEDARSVVAAGADLIAVDATDRPRADGSTGAAFVRAVVRELGPRVLADVDSLAAGLAAREAGAVAVASTLAGYVGDTPTPAEPDLELVERLAAALDCPVLAEGRYATPDHVRAALGAGAFAVVVGTAITDAVTLTRRLADATRRSLNATVR